MDDAMDPDEDGTQSPMNPDIDGLGVHPGLELAVSCATGRRLQELPMRRPGLCYSVSSLTLARSNSQ